MKQHPEDKEILNLYAQGDIHSAFNGIVKKYGPLLYKLIIRYTKSHEPTNDVLQNVFLKTYENLSNFREESNLYTWLYRIARNEALNFIAKEKVRKTSTLDLQLIEIIPGHQALDNLSPDDILNTLEKAVESLPEKQRVIFEMKYFQELKYSEMSQILNTSEGALKAGFHHAKQKIELFLINELNHL